MIARKAEHRPQATWLPAHAAQLYARLMSRLMVDMAGGVMENANVQLDRYGLPVIPGSAVKGCARRMALQALHDWVQAQADHPTPDDACAPCGEGFSNPAEMLAAIARIFGWTTEDWKTDKKDGHYKSDFAWATGGNQELLQNAKSRDPAFDIFGGTIAFLSASPNRDPGLELDVVTPHHTKYYQGELSAATDTEEPVPVFFPAVKPQGENDYFTFPLIPLRLAQPGDLDIAKRWLAHGLQLLGLGAKTNAGYGWFTCNEALQNNVSEIVRQQIANAKRAAEAAAKAQAEAERLAQAPPHERFQIEYSNLGDEPFAAQAKKFEELSEDQRLGFILALKNQKRETAKRWSKRKPELLKPWQNAAQNLNPPIQLP
jgi:CRISPR type III-B/RAMP module RAMP protein Cmr6